MKNEIIRPEKLLLLLVALGFKIEAKIHVKDRT